MFSLVGEMFLLMFTGYIARRTGIITKDGKLCLTNLISLCSPPAFQQSVFQSGECC